MVESHLCTPSRNTSTQVVPGRYRLEQDTPTTVLHFELDRGASYSPSRPGEVFYRGFQSRIIIWLHVDFPDFEGKFRDSAVAAVE